MTAPDLFEATFLAFADGLEGHACVLLRRDGTIAAGNAAVESIEGFPLRHIAGRHLALFYSPEEVRRGRPEELLGRAAGDEGCVIEESWRDRPDGSRFFARVALRPLRDASGAVAGFLRMTSDLSAERAAEAALRESEARFRTMADGAPVLLWMAGTDANCDFFNEGWLRFTGRTLEQERGVGWAEGVHPEDFQRCMDTYLGAYVARVPFTMEYRLRRADGAYRWVYDQGRPRFSPDGAFAGYIGSCVDVTEAREALGALERANRELARRAEELAGSLEEREVLLREVHHRVRNNLQIVCSLLGFKARQAADGDAREVLEDSLDRVSSIAMVHERLYHAGGLARVPFADYVRRLATDVFHSARPPRAGVNLDLEIDEVALALDEAIPCGLILSELIINAVEHAFPDGRGGRIRVELRALAPRRYSLAVTDDGVGISEADSKPEALRSLGLYLVHTLAEQIGAELEVRREGGTSFRMTFCTAAVEEEEECQQKPLRAS